MTDYRPRNQELLYLERGRAALGWCLTAIFGLIGAIVALMVGAYLTDSYNPASTGFTAAIQTAVTRQAAPEPPIGRIATRTTNSGL
jgi:hypothetical protein